MISVLLVDDHQLVRTGIQALLNSDNEIQVVAVADSGEQAVAMVGEMAPDVILMDVSMPGIGGVEASRRILRQNPAIKIIGLSAYNDGPIPQQLLKLGVLGFISKSSSAEEMICAIRKAIEGKRYLCSDVANNLAFQNLLDNHQSPFGKLSQREAEIVTLILQGKTIQEMAEMLSISSKTVNTYRYRVYEKLKIKNDVELTRLAVKFGHLDTTLM
ncbi:MULTISPECIES: response regulator [Methylomicrobium]|uniref:Response regulator containing a CheY-like receiver domain and an HTH DNA-binding domain n=1 Tax=Methylomicrobium album BG8 TaxID=686340 RepID=H8GL47_METAL|nr:MULTISPECIES: response regulator [Methylomicrobium]EIC30528.1 response regulator containing a CheY-like receiver domain and an HTH DNA-binding domain [Methylomicrobium album BG8]